MKLSVSALDNPAATVESTDIGGNRVPQPRLSIRKIKEVLRLQALGLKQEQIARSCGISQRTVSEYQARYRCRVNWDQMAE